MKKVLIGLLFIITLFSTSCTFGGGSVTTFRNNDIEKETIDTIKVLDDKVLESIKDNDVDKVLDISSKSIKNDSAKLKELLKNINESAKDRSFDYKDRYYCKVNKVGKYNFTIGTLEDDPFYIKVDALSTDVFVSLIKSNSKINDYMLSLIYIKEQGEWKLNTFYFGDYSYQGMNASELYKEAKSLNSKGYTVPAGLYLSLSSRLLRPAPFLQYKEESEIVSYGKNLQDSIKKNYGFPKKLESASEIEIYGLDVQCVKEGLLPVIKYTTNTELINENAVKKEANVIDKEVINLYPGMKETFKFFLYEAYSEPPVDPKIKYNCYRTVVNHN